MAAKSLIIKDYRREIPGGFKDDTRTEWAFPVIEYPNGRGKNNRWQIKVRLTRTVDGNTVFIPILDEYFDAATNMAGIAGWIKVDAGVVGGKVRESEPTIVASGKNTGRANATNVFQQTLRDALSLHNKQLSKVAKEGPVGDTVRYPPMLAQDLRTITTKPDITQGVYVQKKYNGVRGVATLDFVNGEPKVIIYSRRGKTYPLLEHIKRELLPVLLHYHQLGKRLYLDGELYLHGRPLQEIAGVARRDRVKGDELDAVALQYHVYDCFFTDELAMPYSERKTQLEDICRMFAELEYLQCVETFYVNTQEDLNRLYQQFLDAGFEGAMVRPGNQPYQFSYNEYHSANLLKMKPRYDAEYEIIGYDHGEKGKASRALMMICKTPAGIEFYVTPAKELAWRIQMYTQMGQRVNVDGVEMTIFERDFKGRKLIVYYDEKTNDDVPARASTEMEVRDWD
ncbi:phage-associated DNA ligase [Faustovirus]|nr:phage-associated DNA ligase [Faustovirus]AMN84773.1 phage-associated DNA ligase [Faustovirus]AMP44095.1 DNA ligase, phage-associated [Faustovirus]QKE50456.1 DNA ligase [Faustovirus]